MHLKVSETIRATEQRYSLTFGSTCADEPDLRMTTDISKEEAQEGTTTEITLD